MSKFTTYAKQQGMRVETRSIQLMDSPVPKCTPRLRKKSRSGSTSRGRIEMEGPAGAFLDEINSVDSTPPLIVEIPCVYQLNIFHQKYCRIWTQGYNSLGQARTRPPLPRPTSLPQNGQLLYLTYILIAKRFSKITLTKHHHHHHRTCMGGYFHNLTSFPVPGS